MNDDSVRLNKFLALHSGISRRQADEFIERGRVKVNGKRAVLGAHIGPNDKVFVDDDLITSDTKLQYVILNKPLDYVSSRREQGDTPTLYSLLPDSYHVLKPVGRLDRNSSGLILLTNDGDFAQRMTHPRYGKVKQYTVALERPLEPLHQQMINDIGVDLEDGKSKLTLEKIGNDGEHWKVIMHEGRNRQIRRTFLALGYLVTELHRTDFGPYTLGDLAEGEYREVQPL
jgi:23S rRNA pseudouridine2605 synthase